jgi:signal transduction histidine kinase
VGLALHELGAAHEEQLRVREGDARSRRLESLGQLAGGVAHDFNNLLAVVLNYSHVLAESLPPGDPRRDDAEEITRTGRRAADLAQQLLLFSRRDISRPEVVDVPTALRDMHRMLATMVGEHVDLRVHADPGVMPVWLGAGQFDQILLNLVVNARDAMPNGGRLSILAEDFRRRDTSDELRLGPGRYLRLTVRDSGEGMSAGVRERACEPFFSTKSAGEGTGLGLATVYGIVNHAGGALEIRSRQGAGTSVVVHLPAAVDVEEAVEREDREGQAGTDRGRARRGRTASTRARAGGEG